ncbi:MAG: hypothetical protein ACO1OC_11065, partial [Tuberibacillus sp.]
MGRNLKMRPTFSLVKRENGTQFRKRGEIPLKTGLKNRKRPKMRPGEGGNGTQSKNASHFQCGQARKWDAIPKKGRN